MMKIFKNKKAQNVAEYAILIALVVGAIIAIQTFAKRALQARVRDASQFMVDNTNFGGNWSNTTYRSGQYEPYYAESQSTATKYEQEVKGGTNTLQSLTLDSSTNTVGTQNAVYDATDAITNGMEF